MKSKIGVVLFALVFALGFGAGGAYGVAGLAGHLSGWWQARNWQSVPATVVDAALKTSHDDTTTYQVTARYRYVFDGHSYEGTRVGFSRGSDNVGSWQTDQYARLMAAKREGRSIAAWVNPKRPDQSVIDRSIRWGMVAFSIPFATLFPMVSLGALWVIFRTVRTPAQELAAPPKLERNSLQIKSDARAGVLGSWLFASFWGLIAFPIAFLVVPDQFGKSWVWLVVMLFPLVGVGLIWAAAKRTLQLVRSGEVAIQLSPLQPQLGEAMSVQATFSRMPAIGEYTITLVCEEVDTRGDNTQQRTVWTQARAVQVNGMHATASFLPPAHLPPSQPHTDLYHRWRVLLTFPDGKDERGFDVVVDPAREGVAAETVAAEHVDTVASDSVARPVPESVATITDEFSRLHIDYSAANARGSAIASLLFTLVFGASSAFLLFGVADGAVAKLMGVLFAGVGVALLGASAYAWSHGRVVEIAHGRLRVANRWLLQSKQEDYAVADVRRLVTSIRGTTTVGSRRYDHHQIKALLHDGRDIVLASDIRDAGVAQTLKQLLQRHLGVSSAVETSPARGNRLRANLASMTPADQARALRVGRRFKLGLKILGLVMLLAVFWDFFGALVS